MCYICGVMYSARRCINVILDISNRQQWSQHGTMAEVRESWGDTMTVTTSSPVKDAGQLVGYLRVLVRSHKKSDN